jgi:hypothetical protein
MATPTSVPATRLTFDYKAGGYFRNHISRRYIYSSGKMVIPIMGEADYPPTEETSVSVQVHSPFGFMILFFEMGRIGAQPRLPTPYLKDANVEFLGGELDVSAPLILTDEVTYVWSASGTYYYRLKRPVWTVEGFKTGVQTIDNTPPDQNVIKATQFVPNADLTLDDMVHNRVRVENIVRQ